MMKRRLPAITVYRVIAIATVRVSNHEDFWRPPHALQRIIESELGQMLLRICGLSVEVEHIVVEPMSEKAVESANN